MSDWTSDEALAVGMLDAIAVDLGRLPFFALRDVAALVALGKHRSALDLAMLYLFREGVPA